MTRLRRLILALALVIPVGLPVQVTAQEQTLGILTLNQERFFNQSAFGVRVLKEIDARSQALTDENHRIEEELKAEEIALTEQRKALEPAAFRELADAFDNKVEDIRAEQARKTNDLNHWAEAEQQRFIDTAYPELLKLANELGALVILDQRTTIITSGRIDVTDRAIERANAVIGDGLEPPKE